MGTIMTWDITFTANHWCRCVILPYYRYTLWHAHGVVCHVRVWKWAWLTDTSTECFNGNRPDPQNPPLRTLNYYSCRDSVDRLATRGPLICGCPGIPTAARLQTRGSWPTFCRNRRKVIPFDYPRLFEYHRRLYRLIHRWTLRLTCCIVWQWLPKAPRKENMAVATMKTTNPTEGPIRLIRKNLSCSSTNLTTQA